jgi:hypothetical protein
MSSATDAAFWASIRDRMTAMNSTAAEVAPAITDQGTINADRLSDDALISLAIFLHRAASPLSARSDARASAVYALYDEAKRLCAAREDAKATAMLAAGDPFGETENP